MIKSNNFIKYLVCGVLFVLGAAIMLFKVFDCKTVSPEDIAAVKFSGMEYVGTAKVSLDKDKIMENDDLNDEQKNVLIDNVQFVIDQNSDISNGDTVTVSLFYNEDILKDAKIKLSDDKFEVKAEGLEKAEKLDLFQGCELNCDGFDKYARLCDNDGYDMNFKSRITMSTQIDSNIVFYCFKDDVGYSSKGYSNGDTVEISANIKRDIQLENINGKYWFKYNNKNYVVDEKKAVKKFKVSGLKEPEKIDVFENANYVYSGGSKYGIHKMTCSEKYETGNVNKIPVAFNIYNHDNLKKGDSFKAVAEVNTMELGDLGYEIVNKPNSTEQEFYNDKDININSDKPEYVFVSKNITIDDDFISYLKKYGNKLF